MTFKIEVILISMNSHVSSLNYKLTKQFLLVVLVTFGVVATWNFVIIPESQKLPNDFEIHIEHDGEDQIVEDVFGELSAPFRLRESVSLKVIDIDGDILTISSKTTGERSDTGEIIFDMNEVYYVNRVTLMHTDNEGKQFGFLPNVKQQDYDFRHPLIFEDTKLVYQEMEVLSDLETYIFTTETIGSDITKAFPQFYPHTIKYDAYSKFWIEPITGNLLLFEKNWDAYLVENGERRNTVEKGWKRTTDYSVFILSQSTKTEIEQIQSNKIIIPIFSGTITFVIGILIILERRLLFIIKDKLKKELELKMAKKELEISDIKLKKEKLETIGLMSSSLSHNLRNPLAAIKGMSDMLKFYLKDKLDESNKHRFSVLDESILNMTDQIEGVLAFVQKKPLNIESHSILKILEDTVEKLIIPYGIEIDLPKNDVEINCDSQKIEVVFSNVISNAIQSIQEKGHIKTRIKTENRQVIIEIEDSGVGIDKEIISKIFDPLFTTKNFGTGLGLAACKGIIQQHKGTISVKNNPTTFMITLPRNLTSEKVTDKNI